MDGDTTIAVVCPGAWNSQKTGTGGSLWSRYPPVTQALAIARIHDIMTSLLEQCYYIKYQWSYFHSKTAIPVSYRYVMLKEKIISSSVQIINGQQWPSNRRDLLMKYVASGQAIISILKKNSFLSICTGVSCNLQPTSYQLCNLLNMTGCSTSSSTNTHKNAIVNYLISGVTSLPNF